MSIRSWFVPSMWSNLIWRRLATGRARKRGRPSISIDVYCFNFGFWFIWYYDCFLSGGEISGISEIIKEILIFDGGLCLFCWFIGVGFLFGWWGLEIGKKIKIIILMLFIGLLFLFFWRRRCGCEKIFFKYLSFLEPFSILFRFLFIVINVVSKKIFSGFDSFRILFLFFKFIDILFLCIFSLFTLNLVLTFLFFFRFFLR